MRWVLLLVSIGGCGAWVPPAAGPAPRVPGAVGGSSVHEPSAPMTAHRADPRQPRAACDDKGAALSEWPDALIRVANAVR
jgi:hypothetical protein